MISLGNKLVLVFVMFLLASCHQSVKFDPDIYVTQPGYIINEHNVKVMADESRFLDYACMHHDKWVELKEVLDRSTVIKRRKKPALGMLTAIILDIETKHNAL